MSQENTTTKPLRETFGGPQPTGQCTTCGTTSFAVFVACEDGYCDFLRTDANQAGNSDLRTGNR